MNTPLLLTVICAAACMADVSHLQPNKPQVEIVRNTQDILPDGSFKWAYETGDGSFADAEGSPGGERQSGSYRYISPEGQPIEVHWVAGPEGFSAQGDSIHPTPDYVLRTVEYNAAHPYKEPVEN